MLVVSKFIDFHQSSSWSSVVDRIVAILSEISIPFSLLSVFRFGLAPVKLIVLDYCSTFFEP